MIVSSYPLPNDFLEVVNSIEFEEVGGFIIDKVEFTPHLSVHISVHLGNVSNTISRWEIQVVNCKDYQIEYQLWFEDFIISDRHPLVSLFTEDQYELYIGDQATDPAKLATEIYKAHIGLFDGKNPIEKYLRLYLHDACSMRYGLFACGPKAILETYKGVLDTHGIRNNIRMADIPSEILPLKILELGYSYFVGTDFNVKRVQ